MPQYEGIFTQIAVNGKLVIPPQKPEAECIIATDVSVIIEKAVVIETPLNYPEDNFQSELQKVVVAGTVRIQVKYSALVPDQRVHAAHFDVPFCTLIEWPDGPPQGAPITVKPTIEKKIIKLEPDGRKLFKAIVIRLDVYR